MKELKDLSTYRAVIQARNDFEKNITGVHSILLPYGYPNLSHA